MTIRPTRPKAPWTLAFPEQMRPAKAVRIWKRRPGKQIARNYRPNPKSEKRLREEQVYFRVRAGILTKYPLCAWCCLRRPHKPKEATTMHHTRGRDGTLYTDPRFMAGLCFWCHKEVNEQPDLARTIIITYYGGRLPLLCAKGDWGKQQ